MSGTRGAAGPQVNDDVIALLVLAVFFGGPVLAMLTGAGDGVATWLLARGVLTRTDVVVSLAAGAGLDLARLAIVAGAVLALLAWAARRAQRRRGISRRLG